MRMIIKTMIMLVFPAFLGGCSTLKIIDRPIIFDAEREALSIEYLEKRHGIEKTSATIIPRMVVVHHTVIPTADRTFDAFNDPILPSAREGIQSASNLNVSSQYLVDRDGKIFRLLPDTVFARHTIGLNHCAIGIENVGGTEDLPLTQAQLRSNIDLIRLLAKNYPVEYVIGHHEYQSFIGHELWKETDPNYLTTKYDPGDAFMSDLRAAIEDLNLKGPPQKINDMEVSMTKYNNMIDPDHWNDNYERFKEVTLTHRRFKHEDLQPLLTKVGAHPHFTMKNLGYSVEGKSISLLTYGAGDIDVLLWSQMHGNEATATAALMDIFNYLTDDESDKSFKAMLRQKLKLHFIPMLNPDGSDRFERRNTMGVDLNRDALRLQNPESRILKSVRDSLSAEWGFNLHDQSRYYSVGLNPDVAAISFLAPAYNYEKEVNEVRGNAMKLIGVMNDVMQRYVPGKVAKYNDDFEPRAFGDNIQKWGTSTILIESGGFIGDREKQKLRQLNYVSLLAAFQSIALGSYKNEGIEKYEAIPFNDSNVFHELIVRNGTVMHEGVPYILDIAFRLNETDYGEDGEFYLMGQIEDIGDLSTSYGYEEFDASRFVIESGTLDQNKLDGLPSGTNHLKMGRTDFLMDTMPPLWEIHDRPFRIYTQPSDIDNGIDIGNNPSLLLKKEGKYHYAIINGRLIQIN